MLLMTWLACLLGQAIIAAPWAAVLTFHYGRVTLSTAGAANHANMGPGAFGNDPLWNPGLVADFIADPHFGPDWSPLDDSRHFLQQLRVIYYNLKNCIGYVLPWVVLAGVFAAAQRFNRHRPAEKVVLSEDFPGLWWCVMTVALYCGGYCFINLESRYLVTVITPLLCLGAMLVVCGPARAGEDGVDGIQPGPGHSTWWVIPMILLVSLQDVNRMVNIPLEHPQSARLAPFRPSPSNWQSPDPAQAVRRQPLAPGVVRFLCRRRRTRLSWRTVAQRGNEHDGTTQKQRGRGLFALALGSGFARRGRCLRACGAMGIGFDHPGRRFTADGDRGLYLAWQGRLKHRLAHCDT